MSTDVLQPGGGSAPAAHVILDSPVPLPVNTTGAVDATIVAPLPLPVTGAIDATIVGQPIGTDPTDDAARLLGIVSVDPDTTVAVTAAALLGAIDGLTEEVRQLRELIELIAT